MLQYIQHLFLLFTLLIEFNVGDDCVYQGCDCSVIALVINCESRQLTTMPARTSSKTYYSSLNIDMNGITDIPAGNLPSLLQAVSFTENPIITIADNAFLGSTSTLETLSFSSVRFTRIPDAFRSLRTLNSLSIRDASIQDWNEEVMKIIGKTLQNLDLENVGMTSWPNWLQYFTNLTTLTVTGGSISTVPDNALDNVTNTLITLSIYENDLTTVPKAFSKFTALQNLYIQENKIVDLTWLPQGSKLKTLSLNNNMISDSNHLSTSLYPFSASLGYLDIRFNRLTAIPNITFLTHIGNLDFGNNRLSDPYSGAVPPGITYIYFTNNLLPAIPRVLTTLHSVPDLILTRNSIAYILASDIPMSTTNADLGFNLITELKDNSFPINCSLTILHLNNNPIVAISSLSLKNLASLHILDLRSTRLTRLPLALGSLDSLDSLDMTDASRLVCTCQEKSLQHVILSMASDYVLGNCGLMNIYEFFTKLTPNCPT